MEMVVVHSMILVLVELIIGLFYLTLLLEVSAVARIVSATFSLDTGRASNCYLPF